MKVIISGSRWLTDYDKVASLISEVVLDMLDEGLIDNELRNLEIVHGAARGVDEIAREWARRRNVRLKPFPADWDNLYAPGAVKNINSFGNAYNVRAGFDRNQKMADYAAPDGVLIAIPHPTKKSSGTYDMIDRAIKAGLRVYIKKYE